jgi:hypothetical protein
MIDWPSLPSREARILDHFVEPIDRHVEPTEPPHACRQPVMASGVAARICQKHV